MNLAKFSVQHSLGVNLLSVLILIAGVLAALQIPREAFPNVDYGYVTVTTPFGGSTPKEVEKLVTIPLEDELREVHDIDEVSSVSLEGLSLIFIKLDMDLEDQAQVVNDIQRAVDRVADLPEDADDPLVEELRTQDQPVLIISLSGRDVWEVRGVAMDLEDVLEDVPGVARVDKVGWKDTQIWVSVDSKKLLAYHLSFDEVARALDTRNANIPGGKVYIQGEQHVIRTLGEFETPDEIRQVVVRANDQGNWLTIGDIAKVEYGLEEIDRLDKTNGLLAANLIVVKKQPADMLRLVKRIRGTLEQFKRQVPPGVQILDIEDLPLKYAKRRLQILLNNGLVGSLLLTGVLLMFLGWRIAILTALGIPLSFCVTMLYMSHVGITINLLTMFGLVMVLGMLVYDAIVVAENSYRHMERGMPPREAAVRGTQEVIRPVTATILTTVVFFGSLLFMTGMMGRFVWVIPAVVIVSLLASLFESVVILPSHIADFGASKRSGQTGGTGRIEQNRWFLKMRSGYMRFLKWALRWRWRLLAGVLIAMMASGVLAKTAMKFILFPARGIEMLYVRAEAPSGMSMEQLEERLRPIEAAIGQLPSHELDHFITTIGMHQDRPGDPQQRRGRNLGQISVYLTTASGRKREAQEIIEDLREKVGQPKGIDVTFQSVRTGPPVGKPVEAHLRGEDFEVLEQIAEEYKQFLAGIRGVKDIRDNYEPGKPELQVIVDEQAAKRARVAIADVGRAIRYAYEGIPVTSIKRTEEEIDVLVRFPKDSQNDISSLRDIMIENDRGDLVPLKRIARFVQAPGVSYITHLDHKRSINVTAELDEETVTSGEVHRKLEERFKDLSERYPGYSVRYGGEQEETIESFQNFRQAFFVALLISYAILAVTFNSLLHPVVVMTAIPFGLIGVVVAFFFHGLPLSFMTLLGTIALSGVVLNDSIVLVSFILEELRGGKSLHRAILSAGRLRFRPVMLTTVSTFVALFPVAYGIGGLDPFLRPAALAITWGLLCATVLTLVFIPCLYAIEEDVRRWMVARWPRLVHEAQLALAKKTG